MGGIPSSRIRGWLTRIALATGISLLLLGAASVGAVLYLRDAAPPYTAFILLARSADPATGQPCESVRYDWVEADRIARDLRLAVVVAEDQRFALHRGFDTVQIQSALQEQSDTGRRRGASTISQQLAKNLFLWPGGGYFRKGIEAWFTIWIEQLWPKSRILDVYLNVAQFGPCTFGAEAAAQSYFEHSAGELQPHEAALLATVLPNPAQLRAWNPGPYAQRRREEILGLMEKLRDSPHLRGL